jgi:hypothetical protein
VSDGHFAIDGQTYPFSEQELGELAWRVRNLDPAAAEYVESAARLPDGGRMPDATEEQKRYLRFALEGWVADIGYDALPERVRAVRDALLDEAQRPA